MLRQLRSSCWNENMPVHAPPLDCSGDCFRYPNYACNFLSKINLSVNRAAVQCLALAAMNCPRQVGSVTTQTAVAGLWRETPRGRLTRTKPAVRWPSEHGHIQTDEEIPHAGRRCHDS